MKMCGPLLGLKIWPNWICTWAAQINDTSLGGLDVLNVLPSSWWQRVSAPCPSSLWLSSGQTACAVETDVIITIDFFFPLNDVDTHSAHSHHVFQSIKLSAGGQHQRALMYNLWGFMDLQFESSRQSQAGIDSGVCLNRLQQVGHKHWG